MFSRNPIGTQVIKDVNEKIQRLYDKGRMQLSCHYTIH